MDDRDGLVSRMEVYMHNTRVTKVENVWLAKPSEGRVSWPMRRTLKNKQAYPRDNIGIDALRVLYTRF